jgi:hypothetical protein
MFETEVQVLLASAFCAHRFIFTLNLQRSNMYYT